MSHLAVNLLCYQAAWFALVLSAAAGEAWLGVTLGWAIVALHLWLVRSRAEQVLVASAVGLGLVIESVLVSSELVRYASPRVTLPWLPPFWILTLWAVFAITLRHSLRWLQGHLGMATAVGAIFGPLAFRVGEALGAVQFAPERGASYLALAVAWGAAMPVLMAVARRPVVAAAWE